MTRKPPTQRPAGQAAPPPLKRGPWTAEEDEALTRFVEREGEGRWRTLPRRAGLARCGKSCRLRWVNYLRPDIKRGPIAEDEEDLILRLHRILGNRWSLIAGRLPGRTDNEIKNYWNSHLSKMLIAQGIDPRTHRPLPPTPAPAGLSHGAAAAKTPPPVEPAPPPPPAHPTSSAADTGGDGFAATMSIDIRVFEEFDDPFLAEYAARDGFYDIVDDGTLSSFLDSLISDDGQFVEYFLQGDGDHKNVNNQPGAN